MAVAEGLAIQVAVAVRQAVTLDLVCSYARCPKNTVSYSVNGTPKRTAAPGVTIL
jgi:hypothetical protein